MIPLLATNKGIVAPKLEGDVGYDLHLRWDTVLYPGQVQRLEIGEPSEALRLAIPGGHWGSIFARSGTVAHGIVVVPTVIDSGYRGPIYIFAYTLDQAPLHLSAGARLAQLVLFPSVTPPLAYTKVIGLPPSQRGERGFGSTGNA